MKSIATGRGPRRRLAAGGALAAALLGPMAGVTRGDTAPADAPSLDFSERELRRILSMSPLPPVPPDPTNAVADHPGAARLGQQLFFDPRLSANGAVSCDSCHDPGQSFTDGLQTAEAIGKLDRHTPALWNVAHNRWQFWDGRADSLWAQALVPLEEPREHGFTRVQCARLIHDDPALRRAYEGLFGPLPPLDDTARFPVAARPVPDDPTHAHHVAWMAMRPEDRAAVDRVFANLGKSLAAYQRRLVSGASPFDVFVAGLREHDPEKLAALSPSARRGLRLFVGPANCRLCHLGPNFTDGEFHATGIPPLDGGPLRDPARYDGIAHLKADPFNARGPFSDERDGAAAEKVRSLLRSTESWGQFKTPSLRNVALTPPYMHQGQLETLEDVVAHYSTLENAVLPGHHREQLLVPLNLSPGEVADLVAFLRSLTGAPVDPALLGPPAAPGATAEPFSDGSDGP